MTMRINPMTDLFAAEVVGLDLTKPISDSVKAELNEAFAKYHVLAFRDQHLTPAQYYEAVKVFGEIFPQERGPFRLKDFPEIGFVSSEDRVTEGGPRIVRGEQYHTDHSVEPSPPKATVLYGVKIPTAGGDTQFVDVHTAYDDLSQDVKDVIDRSWALHVYESRWSPRKKAKLSAEDQAKMPSSIHPLVRVHGENHRKAIYLNTAHIERIYDMDDEKARPLLDHLMAHVQQPKYEYRHKWHLNDMVIWDNRSVLHQANGDYDPEKESRLLYRLMVRGEKPIPVHPETRPQAQRETALA